MKDFKEIPDSNAMEKAAQLEVLDARGEKHKFGSLLGDGKTIVVFIKSTNFTWPIYTDPTRKLYHTLGMDVENLEKTPPGQEKKSYLTLSAAKNLAMSLWRGPIKHPSLVGKNGNISQLGGEFIFGPGNTCSFASRMVHTEDHTEVADLLKEAGIELPSSQ
ncbi:hypothetical protein CVT26_013011 [Gymnopilus dilepis]|uniref:Alkyl hydroperoxide reductase subunit C/ Thiol specific antioxidant domain-containing protein n=1 Tax=Gymnopilus dilepis TaxID=231916 RepID=A0A409WVN9_9AGAR|nr:hypothetical protein CVT26_013011 [Gymnopilus dilepis]